MNPIRTTFPFASLVLATLVTLSGCDGAQSAGPETEVEQVSLSISEIPEGVACIRVSGVGASRSVVRNLTATSGASLNESFSGLPVGPVTFRAEAFPAACDDVTRSTIPTWVSMDAEVNVTLARSTSVELSLYRNARAKVSLSFVDEGASDGGAPDAR
jgi:hypothetical protein